MSDVRRKHSKMGRVLSAWWLAKEERRLQARVEDVLGRQVGPIPFVVVDDVVVCDADRSVVDRPLACLKHIPCGAPPDSRCVQLGAWLDREQRLNTHMVFRAWRGEARRLSRLRQRFIRYRNRSCRRALIAWSEALSESWRLLMAERVTLQRFRRRVMLNAWSALEQTHVGGRRTTIVLREAAGRLMRRTLGMTWELWRCLHQAERRKVYIMGKFVSIMTHKTLNRALHSWLAMHQAERRKVYIMGKFVSIMTNKTLSKALRTWVEAHEARKQNRAIIKMVIKRMINGKMANAFSSWKDMHEHRKRIVSVRLPPSPTASILEYVHKALMPCSLLPTHSRDRETDPVIGPNNPDGGQGYMQNAFQRNQQCISDVA